MGPSSCNMSQGKWSCTGRTSLGVTGILSATWMSCAVWFMMATVWSAGKGLGYNRLMLMTCTRYAHHALQLCSVVLVVVKSWTSTCWDCELAFELQLADSSAKNHTWPGVIGIGGEVQCTDLSPGSSSTGSSHTPVVAGAPVTTAASSSAPKAMPVQLTNNSTSAGVKVRHAAAASMLCLRPKIL